MAQSQQAKNKAAGTRAETQVVDYLKVFWPGAERRRLSGANDKGDISGVGDPVTGRTVIEVKNEKKLNFSSYLKEVEVEMENDKARFGVAIARRRGTTDVARWYAVMTVSNWVAMRTEIEALEAKVKKLEED